MLEFDCSFFQQTVPQYNLEHMSIDNMHNESVGIFVHKMACDNFTFSKQGHTNTWADPSSREACFKTGLDGHVTMI